MCYRAGRRSPVNSRGAFGLNSASENGFNLAPVGAPTLAGAFHLAAPAELWETTGAAVCQSLAFAGTNAFRSGHARPRISPRFRSS